MLTFIRIAEEYKFQYTFEHATEAIDILDELVKFQVSLVIGPSMGGRSKVEVHHKSFLLFNT